MRKSFTFMLICIPLLIFGQSFTDIDNQWVYKRLSMTDVSYFQYSWGNDTIVDGHDLKTLEVVLIRFVGPADGSDLVRLADTALNPFYIQVENGLVRYYDIDNQVFHDMFLTDPNINDEILMSNSEVFPCFDEDFDSDETQTVSGLGIQSIDGTDLTYYTLENQEFWHIGEMIYQNIGGSTSLFPIPNSCESLDSNLDYPEKIVCFSNDQMSLSFDANERIACTELLSVSEVDVKSKDYFIQIVPNPVISSFEIITDEELSDVIKVYSTTGKLLKILHHTQDEIRLDYLPKGVYFLQFQIKNTPFTKNVKIIKK